MNKKPKIESLLEKGIIKKDQYDKFVKAYNDLKNNSIRI